MLKRLTGRRLFSIPGPNRILQRPVETWNYLWQPKAIPPKEELNDKTVNKMACKYFMLPQEYKFDKDAQMGDYPTIKYDIMKRDPFYPYDYPVWRRNYGEIPHHPDQLIGSYQWEDRYDLFARSSPSKTLLMFITCTLHLFVMYKLMQWCDNTAFLPAVPRKYPSPDVIHYKYPVINGGDGGDDDSC